MRITTKQAKDIFLNQIRQMNDNDIYLLFRFFILSKKESEKIEYLYDFCFYLKEIQKIVINLNTNWKEKVLDELFSQNISIFKLEIVYNFLIWLNSNNISYTYSKNEEVLNIGYSIKDFCYENNIYSHNHLEFLINEDLKLYGWKSKWIILIPQILTFKSDSYVWYNKEKHSLIELSLLELQNTYKNWLLALDFEKIIY
ncbi:Hypothetical protein MAU_1880 [Metamycoplasma auris 15026]|uniref:Uncharacterized protein n=1 Tax=Metamycoplasma auris 15026 TaxID=1188233 RepID=N9VCM3_9BACT|nr:hypothetical protein [Metamycoplasma auris]ENY69146.1 Hypothetical protein MAU_1880 [Metamycoplasma auris 15026]